MQNLNFNSVTFFYPSKIIGGAEFLFFRLACYFINIHQLKISYIDYTDGVVKKMFENEDIEVNFISFNGSDKISLPSDTILITPLSSIYEVEMYLTGNFKVFFWSIHPSGLLDVMQLNHKLIPRPLSLNKAGRDLDFLIGKRGVYFMDETNLSYQKAIFKFKNIPDFFVPIFCDKRLAETKPVNFNQTHLGWIGRLSSDKIYSLVNIIHHAVHFASDHPEHEIIIHIIGEGSEKKKIDQIKLPVNVQLIFLGTVVGDNLTTYINENFDVGFAMGTSALEMAGMKKAVILVDFQYVEFPKNNKFRWLYEASNFNVVDKFDEKLLRNISFNDIINLVSTGNHYEEGEKCYRYYEQNHSITTVGNLIVKALNTTNITLVDIRKTDFRVHIILKYLRFIKRWIKNM